jgi:lysophospholipase L1-like esterase
MSQHNIKKRGPTKRDPEQGNNLFERNPRKTLVLTTAFFIIILDALVCVIFPPAGDHSFRCSNPYYHHDFLPNQNVETLWGDRKYRFVTNSLGFRDRTVREVPLASKQKRILLIGDSFLEGMGVPYENSVAGIVGESLKADGTEVLNAAAVSYSPKLYFLKTRYLIEQKHLSFDELYVFIDISDPHDEIIYKYWEPESNGAFRAGLRALNQFFQRHSFFYGYLAARRRLNREKAISNAFPAEGSADSRFWVQDLEEYLRRAEPEKDRFLWPNKQSALDEWGREGLSLCKQYMTEVQKLCDQNNIRLTIVVYPSPYQLTGPNLNGIQVTYWRTFAEERHIDFLNLFPVFIGSEPPETVYARYFIKGDIHWNEAGNRLVAEAVLKHIR